MSANYLLSCSLLGILLAIAFNLSLVAGEEYNCSFPGHVEGDRGVLVIRRDGTECKFKSHDATPFFAINTQGLTLRAGETLEFISDSGSAVYKPPFANGFLVTGLVEPTIIFNTTTQDNSTIRVEFFQNKAKIPVNGDLINNFVITPFKITQLDLSIGRTITDPTHLEIFGSKKGDGHFLLTEASKEVPIGFQDDNGIVNIETSPAFANCSGTLSDKQESSHELTGPDASLLGRPYKCVNLFTSEIAGDQAHFEVNFKNFLDLVDQDDELVIDDGSADTRLRLMKPKASDYNGQIISLIGKKLAVIYNSPRVIKPSKIQFKLTVQSKASGGFVQPGPLQFPDSGQVRFVLQPQDTQQYAAINIEGGVKLQDGANLSVFNGNQLLAKFVGGTFLPPLIAVPDAGAQMILDFNAKSYAGLAKKITFKSLTSNCNAVAAGTSGGFSVIGGQSSTCYWLLASSKAFGLKIDTNSLEKNGCLTIQPLSQAKPIFTRCNISRSDILPIFNLGQSFVQVTLPGNGSRFDASLSSTPHLSSIQLEATPKVEISSSGFPSSYVWSSKNQVYTLNGSGKHYLYSMADVDIRAGEKLAVNNQIVDATNRLALGDLLFSNATVNVTVSRSNSTSDFTLRRGFKIVATQFEQVLVANMTANRLVTPKNATNLLVKVSSTGLDSKFGKRISFNITFSSADRNFDISVHDSRSILGHSMPGDAKQFHGFTSSDTLLITYVVTKPGTQLPEMVVDYSLIEANKTDLACDNGTRFVPYDALCKGKSYCEDEGDLRISCTASGPAPEPRIIETGVGGVTVFILCILMLAIGAVSALYGPDLFRTLDNRFRSGHYTTFTSSE